MVAVPVVDVKQPVKAHVHTERDVDEYRSFFLQLFIQRCNCMDDLHHIHHIFTMQQLLLSEDLGYTGQLQKINYIKPKINTL